MSPKQNTAVQLSDPTEILLSELQLDTDTFQFRNIYADGASAVYEKKKSLDHIDTLANALKHSDELEPLTVWKCEKGNHYVVDGHHRYKAYLKAWEQPLKRRILVRTLPEGTSKYIARSYALGANQKDKLPMTKSQKTQAVWNLICTEEEMAKSSARGIKRITGLVSHETASQMLKAKKRLEEQGELDGEVPLWKDVNSRGWKDEEFDADEHKKKSIEKLSVELSAVLKSHGRGGDTEIISEAFEQSLYDLYRYSSKIRVYPSDELEEEADNPDF